MRGKGLSLALTLALLAGSFALFHFTEVDLAVQDRLYDFTTHRWAVDKKAPLPRLLFYTGPKVVIGILGGALLLGLVLPARWRPAWAHLPWPPRRVWCVIACLAAVPIVIGLMKARSDLYCPWSIERYGGDKPYHHLFDARPDCPPNCGKCFPAGHASGGFALMSLFVLFTSRRARWLGLAAGLGAGWAMGIYQMLKGAHFLSHTVTTMLLAVLIIQIIAWLGQVDSAGHRSP